jgi:triacylglycerol lipase
MLASEVQDLLAQTGAAKVNLVCFSQGGLDCRYLASPNGLAMGDVVASITTLSSPHHGTGVADAALPYLLAGGNGERKAVDALATLAGATFSELASNSHLVAALQGMSEANMPAWNEQIVDAPGTFYQSFAGFSHVAGMTLDGIESSIAAECVDDAGNPALFRHANTYDTMNALLVPSAAFVGHFDPLHPSNAMPNDGVSAIESSKWALFRGCYPADHLDTVGEIDHTGMDPDTGFDYRRMYRYIASDLAARGY